MEISDLIHQVQATMGEDAQNVILRQIGDIAFPAHVAVNLFYIPPQIVLNPDVVRELAMARQRRGSMEPLCPHKGCEEIAGTHYIVHLGRHGNVSTGQSSRRNRKEV